MPHWRWVPFIAAYLVTPPAFAWLLRPLAVTCERDVNVMGRFGITLEFFECEFGWIQPLEFIAYSLASGSYTLTFIALFFFTMIFYFFYLLMLLRSRS